MDAVAVPEVQVSGINAQEHFTEKELEPVLKKLSELSGPVPDSELKTVVDYSGAFPEVRLVRKKDDTKQ